MILKKFNICKLFDIMVKCNYEKGDKMIIKKDTEKIKNISRLGFGCMRLPQLNGKIDEKRAFEMVDLAYQNGINYFDTAFNYHNGESEIFIGKALDQYPRQSYYLATKLPIWLINSEEDVLNIFNQQLEKLDKDYIDFYLIHCLDKKNFEIVKKYNVVETLIKLKNQHKILHLGFSFHDKYEVFEEIINYHNWDFCQIQLNYMDVFYQAGIKGYNLATKKNIPVIVMEPIKGGLLANLPQELSEKLKKKPYSKTDSSFALRFVASFDNVLTILSGMSTLEQVEDNLNTFENYHALTDEENKQINQVVQLLNQRLKNGCTGCKYCANCPKNIEISRIFYHWNQYGVYDLKEQFAEQMIKLKNINHFVDECINCKQCEAKCPQHISITNDFKRLLNDLSTIKK